VSPILLIHGYSAESRGTDYGSIKSIYGSLVDDLKSSNRVVIIDLSRYVSLNDSISIYDIARALDRVLNAEHPELLASGFNPIVHSTGALVIRNWIRLFSPKPSPVRNLIYLAGANFGSGWARIGQGQIARWGRYVFDNGSQRGVKLLHALELGSSQTIDVHLHFLRTGNRMLEDYQVQEYILVGTQADPLWFTFPVRYAKEDGSDGTVRVSGSNLNFNYLSIIPVPGAAAMRWAEVQAAVVNANQRLSFPEFYRINQISQPYFDRPEIPFAIPYHCAHSGDQYGIVSGSDTKEQVQRLIRSALAVPDRSSAQWSALVDPFHQETKTTYDTARNTLYRGPFNYLRDSRNQYDSHAQLILRLRDQDDQPIPVANTDIFFVSEQQQVGTTPVQELIEDTVVGGVSPNVITFYLRTNRFDIERNDWVYLVSGVQDFALEITAVEPLARTEDPTVAYVPLRIPFSNENIVRYVQANRTTIIDVQLVRLPRPETYMIVPS